MHIIINHTARIIELYYFMSRIRINYTNMGSMPFQVKLRKKFILTGLEEVDLIFDTG